MALGKGALCGAAPPARPARLLPHARYASLAGSLSRVGHGDLQDGGLAKGAAGAGQRAAAADGLSPAGAVRVLAHRVGHQRGPAGDYAAPAAEGQPPAARPLRPGRGGARKVRPPLRNRHRGPLRREQQRLERERGGRLCAGAAPQASERRWL